MLRIRMFRGNTAARAAALTIALGLAAACSGKTDESATGGSAGSMTGGSGGGGAGGAAGLGGSAGGGMGGSGASTCPTSPPTSGSPCTEPWAATDMQWPSAHCSWGDDPRPACRAVARCDNGSWTVTQPPATCLVPPLPDGCPTPLPADTTPCSDSTLSCWYQDGSRCWCSACAGGSGYPVCQTIDPPEWYCAEPPSGCPTTPPQAGAPCDVPGASCGPDCELVIVCQDGVWQWLQGNCPICAAPDTPVATPLGERPLASLRVGDLVYSVDHAAIVAVPILLAEHTRVAYHRVVRVQLDSGAALEISPGHPTADGRTFGALTAGSRLDETHLVVSVQSVPYGHDATYDILPASETGTYFAAGALVGSSLH